MLTKFRNYCLTEKSQLTALIWISILAALSLYMSIWIPYYREEGNYTISSYEMLANHHYLMPYVMGDIYGRPPFFNWLMIIVAKFIGMNHMLVAARLVTISCTLGSTAILYWLTQVLSNKTYLAWLTVACYLSGDLLFRRGWIAYADPTFAFFIFAAISAMWIGHQRQQVRWLFWIIPMLSAAFLTKALTAYIFYAVAVIILFIYHRNWRYFLHPLSLLIHFCVIILPIAWLYFIPGSERLLHDVGHNPLHQTVELWKYCQKLIGRVIEIILRFFPVSFLAIYLYIRSKFTNQKLQTPVWVTCAFWISVINIIPYMLTPYFYNVRYLLPVFPLISLCLANILQQATTTIKQLTILILIVTLALKLFISPWGRPWFEHMLPTYPKIFNKLAIDTKNYPLYITRNIKSPDASFNYLELINYIDSVRYPISPIIFIDYLHNKNYLYLDLSMYRINSQDKQLHCYQFQTKKLCVYCHGSFCYKVNSW